MEQRVLSGRRGPVGWGHNSKSFRAAACELASEGIRAARLSGFLICVHARVHAETDRAKMAELIRVAHSLDVDGIVITPANRGASSATPDAAAWRRKTAEARKLLRSMAGEWVWRIV